LAGDDKALLDGWQNANDALLGSHAVIVVAKALIEIMSKHILIA